MIQSQPIERVGSNELFHQPSSFFNEEKLLRDRLNELLCPNEYDSESNWTTPLGQNFLRIRGLSLSHFIRQSVYKKFKGNQIPRQWRRHITGELKVQGDLTSQIWKVIRLLPLSPNPRPDILYRVIEERAIVFFNYLTPKIEPVTPLIKQQRKINRELQSLQNPFNPEVEPETWSFIDSCVQLSNRDRDFESEYRNLIRLRMKLITSIAAANPVKVDSELNLVSKQGRKLIGVSRTPSQ